MSINLFKSLSPSANIISNQIIHFSINWEEIQGFIDDGSTNWKRLRDFQRIGSYTIASFVQDKARKLLEPNNPSRDIGATGQASKNIFIRATGSGNESGFQIYEGSYRGNRYIRLGRREGSNIPPPRAIVEWLVHKNISITAPDVNKTPWRMTKMGGPRANVSSRPPRPWKRDLRQVAAMIGNKMKSTGMEHLKAFMPKGKAKYDYYGEIMKDKRKMGRILEDSFDIWAVVYGKFIKSGQYRRIQNRTIRARTRGV